MYVLQAEVSKRQYSSKAKYGFQRPRGRVNCQTRARARRGGAMHGENLRKFTETRARAPRECYASILRQP